MTCPHNLHEFHPVGIRYPPRGDMLISISGIHAFMYHPEEKREQGSAFVDLAMNQHTSSSGLIQDIADEFKIIIAGIELSHRDIHVTDAALSHQAAFLGDRSHRGRWHQVDHQSITPCFQVSD